MASSSGRQRQLAREKYARQQARRVAEERKRRRRRLIAGVLAVSLIVLLTGGFVIGQIVSAGNGP